MLVVHLLFLFFGFFLKILLIFSLKYLWVNFEYDHNIKLHLHTLSVLPSLFYFYLITFVPAATGN